MTRINLIEDIRGIIRWQILIEDLIHGALIGLVLTAIACGTMILVGT